MIDKTIPAPIPEDFARDAEADMAACEAATPGPWLVEWDNDYDEWHGKSYRWPWRIRDVCNFTEEGKNDADTELIALARTALPAYIRLAEHYRQRAEEAEAFNRRSQCAYCGQLFDVPPGEEARLAAVEHVISCPEHPISKLGKEIDLLERERNELQDDRASLQSRLAAAEAVAEAAEDRERKAAALRAAWMQYSKSLREEDLEAADRAAGAATAAEDTLAARVRAWREGR